MPRIFGGEVNSLVSLTTDYDNPPCFLVHTTEQEQRQEEMAKIVCREGGVQAVSRP